MKKETIDQNDKHTYKYGKDTVERMKEDERREQKLNKTQ